MKRHGITAVALWLLFVLVCGLVIRGTRFTADLSAFLPGRPTPTQQLFIDQLQNGLAARLILVGITGADAEARAALSRDMTRRLQAAPAFVSVRNGEAIEAERDRAFIFSHRYLLSPAVTPRHFTTAGLHRAIADTIDLLASPAGLLIKPLLARDPTGETLRLLDLYNQGARPRTSGGVWVSRDGNRAILLAQTRAAGSDIDGQQQAVETIRRAFDLAVKQAGSAGAQLEMTGPGVFSVASRHTIRTEVARLSLMSTVLIAGLLLVVYRSITALVLGAVPVATGIAAGIAAVSLGFGTVHGVTLGFGVTLIGEAVDYSIYLFIQSRAGHGAGQREPPWARFWATIGLGMMTSIVGFAALLFSGFQGLAQLGLYSIAGLMAAALVTRFVLPSLLPRGFRVRDVSHLGGVLAAISRRAVVLRWTAAGLAAASGAVIYAHHERVWDTDITALSPVSGADRALDESLRRDLGAPDPRFLVIVSGGGRDAALAASERAAKCLRALTKKGVIGGYDSPSRYLPSLTAQRARQAAIPAKAELSRRLHDALAGLPVRPDRLADFLNDAEAARSAPLLHRADLAGTSLALAADAMLVRRGGHWSALLPLRAPPAGTIDPQAVGAALKGAGLSGASFVNAKTELDNLYAGYLGEALRLSLGGAAAIAVLLVIVLRSPVSALRVLIPLALAILVVTASLLAVGYRLTILHLIGMLLIAAVGSNYGLFLERASRGVGAGDYRWVRASLLLANVSAAIVFSLLAASGVPVLRDIGMTVAPGVVLALLFTAVFARRPLPAPQD